MDEKDLQYFRQETEVIEKVCDALYQQGDLNGQVIKAFPDVLAAFQKRLDGQQKTIDEIRKVVLTLYNKEKDLEDALGFQKAHMDQEFLLLYHKEGETMEETKRRMFHHFPKAEGDLRVVQLAEMWIVKRLKEICEKAGASFWLDFGSMLGAVRHGGFIPWDDDTDLGMSAADLERIRAPLSEDPILCLTEKYDPMNFTRQFRVSFRDEKIQVFTDIFVYYSAQAGTDFGFREMLGAREDLMSKLRSDPVTSQAKFRYYDLSADPIGKRADEIIGDYISGLIGRGILRPDMSGDRVFYGIENPLARTENFSFSEKEDLLPLQEMTFEGEDFPVPARPETYLRDYYGAYLSLPEAPHFSHLNLPRGPILKEDLLRLGVRLDDLT